MVGCNHDDWLTTPKIWFENAQQPNEYGAGFSGAREVSRNRTAPQSGMNTAGLAFSRLASYYPSQPNPFANRLKITDEAEYLTNILHQCATVADVKRYIEQYDHSFFIDGVFIYIDSLGDYLLVEPYQILEGNDPAYVLANFCPSITDNEQARQMERYRNGEDFLKKHPMRSSLAYCTALSDTMHVCRKRNGDGTLISSIWDTKDKTVHLYFYHVYDSAVRFSLVEELAKGDHILSIPELFPQNAEFERLVNYKTPFNIPELRILLVVLAGFLALFALLLGIPMFWKNNKLAISFRPFIAMAAINLLLVAYLFVLVTNKYIFYFDAPFKHRESILISASSYIPFLLLVTIVPLVYQSYQKLKSAEVKLWTKTTLVSNTLVYVFLLAGFSYWGLYSIWA